MSIIENALERVQRTALTATSAAPASVQVPEVHPEPDASPQQRIAIDFNLLRAQGELPEAGLERRFADYYREIKRPLVQAMLAGDARPESRLVLVTSALPGEGKSFTALNLALSVARERDVSVLLVDADLPKGHLSRTFGLQGVPGLLDALADESVEVDSLVVGTDIRGLEILPAGKAIEGAAELIASARMSQIATRLARHPRRLVLLDSPPLLASSEARALKQTPGRILIVTRAGRTPARRCSMPSPSSIKPNCMAWCSMMLTPRTEKATTRITATRVTARRSGRTRILIRQLVLAALAVAAPALCLAQAAGDDTTASGQGLPNVSSSGGATLPGATLPGETPELSQEPPEFARYGIAAGIGETDNVNLSSTDPKSQTIAAADLDFDLKRTGSRLDASGIGNFTDLYYLQGAYSNQVLGRFDGLATAKLWADRLRWVVADDYGDMQIDPFSALTPSNLQRVNVFTTGPDLTLRPSYSTFINVDARYTQNSYQSSPFDGHDLLGSAAVGRQLSELASLALVVQAEELRFDNTIVNTNFDRRAAYGRYVIKGARTSIDAQLGVTQANDVGSSWRTSPLLRLLLTRQISPFSIVTLTGGREFTDAAASFTSLTSSAWGGIVVAPVTQTTANLRDLGSGGERRLRPYLSGVKRSKE